jgi:hypothetical protein
MLICVPVIEPSRVDLLSCDRALASWHVGRRAGAFSYRRPSLYTVHVGGALCACYGADAGCSHADHRVSEHTRNRPVNRSSEPCLVSGEASWCGRFVQPNGQWASYVRRAASVDDPHGGAWSPAPPTPPTWPPLPPAEPPSPGPEPRPLSPLEWETLGILACWAGTTGVLMLRRSKSRR